MISRELQCVFVHVPKVAGQSIERVFLDYHGLTWEGRAPLLLRKRNDPSEGPPRLAHLTAREYVERGHLTAAEWEAFFTFSFVRNPWSRAISLYKYLGDHRRMPFRAFVKERLAQRYWKKHHWFIRPQAEFVCDEDGRVIVDFVGRFENIREDFAAVCRRLGLPPDALPHQNPSNQGPWSREHWGGWKGAPDFVLGALRQQRHEAGSTTSYYDAETVDLVGALYRKDVELFGYRFADLAGR